MCPPPLAPCSLDLFVIPDRYGMIKAALWTCAISQPHDVLLQTWHEASCLLICTSSENSLAKSHLYRGRVIRQKLEVHLLKSCKTQNSRRRHSGDSYTLMASVCNQLLRPLVHGQRLSKSTSLSFQTTAEYNLTKSVMEGWGEKRDDLVMLMS